MSLHSLPVSQRNVSLRSTFRLGMPGGSPRIAGLGTESIVENEGDTLLAMETQTSTSSKDSGAREALRGNHSPRLSTTQQSERLRTTILLNLTSVMERMDEQILPAVYSEIGKTFSAGPTQLGYLTLSRALVQALSSPLGGVAGHHYDRIWVTSWGCFIWGAMTCGFAFCTSIYQGICFWAVNGFGLALVIPNSQSCIADFFSSKSRGLAFGALYVTSGLGATLGSLYATNIGTLQLGWLAGWRFAFLTVAAMSFLIGGFNLWLGRDPRRLKGLAGPPTPHPPSAITFREVYDHMISVLEIPTFGIIVAQGIVGSIPWSGMAFLTLYFQLLGMSAFAASSLTALLLGCTAVGGLLGGFVGDRAAIRFPDHGRIAVCQFSVAVGIPFSLLITKVLPHNGESETVWMYGVAMVTCGLLKSWAAPACNNPIFAEIVPVHLRTLVYSFDRCFEGAIAACAAPLVGVLAESLFGFKGTAAPTGDPAIDLVKAKAIGNALLCFMIVPWMLCLLAYGGLHYTYPADRAAALKESARVSSDGFSSTERQRLRQSVEAASSAPSAH